MYGPHVERHEVVHQSALVPEERSDSSRSSNGCNWTIFREPRNWITGTHVMFSVHYLANLPAEVAVLKSMPVQESPRVMMAIAGPVIGMISGIILGLLGLLNADIGTIIRHRDGLYMGLRPAQMN